MLRRPVTGACADTARSQAIVVALFGATVSVPSLWHSRRSPPTSVPTAVPGQPRSRARRGVWGHGWDDPRGAPRTARRYAAMRLPEQERASSPRCAVPVPGEPRGRGGPLVSEIAPHGIPVAGAWPLLGVARRHYYRRLRNPAIDAELTPAYRANTLFGTHHEHPAPGIPHPGALCGRWGRRLGRGPHLKSDPPVRDVLVERNATGPQAHTRASYRDAGGSPLVPPVATAPTLKRRNVRSCWPL